MKKHYIYHRWLSCSGCNATIDSDGENAGTKGCLALDKVLAPGVLAELDNIFADFSSFAALLVIF